ncbi:MAG: branched-chain amino acid ABC transporter ATP-binding protein [Syntrophobacterales bacterium CG_4_8_14_3_um_filter_58_8]|nr:MAG: branched-chain amino acid ABC transporter ATP-binding protein [Syntrophaceae bacterium CG2_30_58_14]PIV02878.1 MAG: branched-chain amino acid ABC transporter ATP-binding protein [Syntrophobacterales bacterium CG03_land_8_20_14_0_80_58_14]PJC74816.1 MAG: branched-chain amino acid ABC transporter ATP-binding protein [Syntrophobacterales bacterium CG_4_8_14_3_um_filter_58_8]
MLRVTEIEVRYSGIPVVHNVSLHVGQGELVTVVGSNGAGKSTLLKTIAGALHPTKGSIQFDGKDIHKLSTPDIVKLGITYIPEARLIFGPLTVEENLELGAYILNNSEETKKNLDFIYSLFPRLKERRSQLSGTLSGGEQQMLAIGRGLMSNPKLLMLDEPSLGLMPKLVDEMFEAVAKLRTIGKTILLVEQNVFESLDICDRGYVLQTGRTIQEGTGKELLNAEDIKKAFLGL